MRKLPGNTALLKLGNAIAPVLGSRHSPCDMKAVCAVGGYKSRQMAEYHTKILLGKVVWLCREAMKQPQCSVKARSVGV